MKAARTKLHALQEHSEKVVINGSRPSPLMINKNSHLICKPSSHKKQRNPTIIYTQSPKVIHTKPRDFMALVQRLTGITHSNQAVFHATASKVPHQPQLHVSENFGSLLFDGPKPNFGKKLQEKENHGFWAVDKTSSALKDGETCVKEEPFLGFGDVPLFTPNSVYKYSDSPFGFLGSLLSPSALEFMKELPEY
ncbi:hypothetical protein VNO77_39561 [Canavalia gladiata]|uniref:VQ domain-containing protein n=1 Tax=Canavalia gladiata TaxID=3824 RepID=A0AAN9JXI1_CANGL